MNSLLYRLTAKMPARLIKPEGRPYMERYYVGQLFGVTFYLHRFVASDRERHLHNHPWAWGRALVLTGRYTEECVTDISPAAPEGCVVELRGVSFWNRVNGNHFHRIAWVRPGTWTLFMHGKRSRVGPNQRTKGWGFLELQDHYVVFQRYISSNPTRWWLTSPTGENVGREPL